jgi:hypothetical protein
MSKKTLNAANLTALGAERLAELLMEVSTGSADIKRRLRMELSHNLGASELAHDVRKRLAAIRKSKARVSWRKRKSLVTDLNTQVAMIVGKIAPDDPNTAFDLLWQFIELAPSIYARADDRRGDIATAFHEALQYFEDIGPHTQIDNIALAERVWAAVSDNVYGEWDDIIGLLAETLGTDGLTALKDQIAQFSDTSNEQTVPDHEAFSFLHDLRGSTDYRTSQREVLAQKYLQEIAELSGDTEGYIAQFTAADLKQKSIAAEVANLKLTEDQPEEALEILAQVDPAYEPSAQDAWDSAYIATLSKLDRETDAQAYRWACFEAQLSSTHLRDFIKALPDFEDVEAEDSARQVVLAYPDAPRALHFCLTWPDLHTAAQLVTARADEFDGDDYEFLNSAADALHQRQPLAATALLRAMIDFALTQGRASRYGHIANYLSDCEMLSHNITDYGDLQTHEHYFITLQNDHSHRSSFWEKYGGR